MITCSSTAAAAMASPRTRSASFFSRLAAVVAASPPPCCRRELLPGLALPDLGLLVAAAAAAAAEEGLFMLPFSGETAVVEVAFMVARRALSDKDEAAVAALRGEVLAC